MGQVAIVKYFNDEHPDVKNGHLDDFAERIQSVLVVESAEKAHEVISLGMEYKGTSNLVIAVGEN